MYKRESLFFGSISYCCFFFVRGYEDGCFDVMWNLFLGFFYIWDNFGNEVERV